MSQDNKPVSLWEMLKEYTCVIPIIQRDYAQGRRGKDLLRRRFFGQLIEAVVNNTPITLDFVYGTPAAHNDGVIYPLDGQQRLTSLWLLYWYVAFRTGELNDSGVCSTLEKFTYHTRTSSRDFCEYMCQNKLVGDNSSVAELITDQPWYSRRFKTDPTVQAMLRSLSDFEQMLAGDADYYNAIWNRLTSEACPVKFYFRSTKDEKISNPDDLYIKMNARGKKLTDFENFKSELFSFKCDDGKEVFRTGTFIKRFENEWTNLFWPLHHEKRYIVDHILFEFFNRMVLAHIVTAGDIEGDDEALFRYITNHAKFSSIDVYRRALTPEFKMFYESVMNGIIKVMEGGPKDGIKNINDLFVSPYTFSYLPIYEDSEKNKRNIVQIGDEKEPFWISDITVARLSRFYAASLYFSKIKDDTPFDRSAFNDWMIFSRNLFDNSGIDTYADAKNILDLFAGIKDNCLNIITFLCSDEAGKLPVSGDLLRAQYEEEREKALKIQECRTGNAEQGYEQLIREAEKVYPFGGAIRFLFRDENGKINWEEFEIKKKHFDEFLNYGEDKKEKYLSPVILRTLLSHVKSWDVLKDIWDIDSSYDSWKRILINKPSYIQPIHCMLLDGVNKARLENFKSSIMDNRIQKGTHEELVKSKFLHHTTWDSFTFREDHTAVVWNSRAQRKRYMLGTPRNRLLAEGVKKGEIEIEIEIIMAENRMLGDGEHFWGKYLFFELAKKRSEKFVLWWNGTEFHRAETGGNDVYVCKRANRYPYFPNYDEREEFAIKVDYDCTYADFINNLVELLEKAENYQSSGLDE